jgi:hypothetical protein
MFFTLYHIPQISTNNIPHSNNSHFTHNSLLNYIQSTNNLHFTQIHRSAHDHSSTYISQINSQTFIIHKSTHIYTCFTTQLTFYTYFTTKLTFNQLTNIQTTNNSRTFINLHFIYQSIFYISIHISQLNTQTFTNSHFTHIPQINSYFYIISPNSDPNQ